MCLNLGQRTKHCQVCDGGDDRTRVFVFRSLIVARDHSYCVIVCRIILLPSLFLHLFDWLLIYLFIYFFFFLLFNYHSWFTFVPKVILNIPPRTGFSLHDYDDVKINAPHTQTLIYHYRRRRVLYTLRASQRGCRSVSQIKKNKKYRKKPTMRR